MDLGGHAADDYSGILYLGQEQVGWWATSVSQPSANLSLVDRVREFGVPYTREFDDEDEEFSCEYDRETLEHISTARPGHRYDRSRAETEAVATAAPAGLDCRA